MGKPLVFWSGAVYPSVVPGKSRNTLESAFLRIVDPAETPSSLSAMLSRSFTSPDRHSYKAVPESRAAPLPDFGLRHR